VTAVEHPAADRAAAYGLERIVVDGNDADVVFAPPIRPMRAPVPARPSLIECMTYRTAAIRAPTRQSIAEASWRNGRSAIR